MSTALAPFDPDFTVAAAAPPKSGDRPGSAPSCALALPGPSSSAHHRDGLSTSRLGVGADKRAASPAQDCRGRNADARPLCSRCGSAPVWHEASVLCSACLEIVLTIGAAVERDGDDWWAGE